MKKSISMDDPLNHLLDEFCKCPRCREWAAKRLKTEELTPLGERDWLGEEPTLPPFLGKMLGKNVAVLLKEDNEGFVFEMVITDLSTGNRVCVHFAAPPHRPPPKPNPKGPCA